MSRCRPTGEAENLVVRHDRDVRVDQRRAAESRSFDHRDITVIQQLVQAERIGTLRWLATRVLEAIRKCADRPLLAALEDADGWLRLRAAFARRAAVMAPP